MSDDGSALMRRMDEWMMANRIATVWVLADGAEAESFYRSCGFGRRADQPRSMERTGV